MAFRFRQFTVEDSRSTMQVGTDAMLLGALTDPGNAARILDNGTGCGVLALMMAQKSHATIDAIEIDRPSAGEADLNFQQSPWNTRLACFNIPIQHARLLEGGKYDLIISNPPFFKNSMKPAGTRRAMARHELSLTMEELLAAVKSLLSEKGRFASILPTAQWEETRALAATFGLHVTKLVRICPYPGGKVTRVISELTFVEKAGVQESELTILDSGRNFSDAYLAATKDFHNFS